MQCMAMIVVFIKCYSYTPRKGDVHDSTSTNFLYKADVAFPIGYLYGLSGKRLMICVL